jgi:murein DD-endopeptidase MepM/ murein hydrolase activator NlpD
MNVKKIFHFTAIILLCLAIVAIVLDIKVSGLPIAMPAKQNFETQKVIIDQDEMLSVSFAKTRLPISDYGLVLAELRKYMDVNLGAPGDFYEVRFLPSSRNWFSFAYYPKTGDEFFLIKKDKDGRITSSKQKLSASISTQERIGKIDESLGQSMSQKNIQPEIVLAFSDIFAGRFDFLTEVKKGDEFKLIYDEEIVNKKHIVIAFTIKIAQYKVKSGPTYTAIYYKSSDGKTEGYYDVNANSLNTKFLYSPIQYKNAFDKIIMPNVRSNFTIDYTAPKGTPVSAVADGIVLIITEDSSFGRRIIISHGEGHESSYAHLSDFASGIGSGATVKKGQIIGYVGDTASPGNEHLSFSFTIYDEPVNYYDVLKNEPVQKLTGDDKANLSEIITKYRKFLE